MRVKSTHIKKTNTLNLVLKKPKKERAKTKVSYNTVCGLTRQIFIKVKIEEVLSEANDKTKLEISFWTINALKLAPCIKSKSYTS